MVVLTVDNLAVSWVCWNAEQMAQKLVEMKGFGSVALKDKMWVE